MTSHSSRFEIVIAGSGPVGLVTAILCRQRGARVLLCDPRGRALDKACGEGIMPRGVNILQELPLSLEPARLAGIRFVDGQRSAGAPFEDGVGYGVRRTDLSQALLDCAERVGVELSKSRVVSMEQRPGSVRVTTNLEELHARWLVGADGLHSRIRQLAALGGRKASDGRYGVRGHYRIEPWTEHVEVHYVDRGEFYVTPLGPDRIGVALLSCRPLEFERALSEAPQLASRLRGARREGSLRGAGPLLQSTRKRTRGAVALVGDAAGYVDAATGEGLSLGFACAQSLCGALEQGSLTRYEQHYQSLSRNYRVMARFAVFLSRNPSLRRVLFSWLQQRPLALSRLLSINDGQRPLRDLLALPWLGSARSSAPETKAASEKTAP